LEVFGSAAQGEGFTDQSDLDFLVEFLAMSPTDHADAYFGLLNALKELFGRGVDLLEVKAIDNPYLLESIDQNRVELYAA
jgi:predicted nucleotidyltransferase